MPTYPEEARNTAIERVVKQAKEEKVDDMERAERTTKRTNPEDFTIIHSDTDWSVG